MLMNYSQNYNDHIGLVLAFLFLCTPFSVFASTTDGTINTTNKYAWSERVGWINFNTSGGNVHVTDTTLSGYAWSEHTGWLNLSPSGSNFVANNGEGVLSGYAWGEGIGYIDFGAVTIDASGYFHGYASTTATGRISFNCQNGGTCASSDFKVQTDWRPVSARTAPAVSSSAGSGSSYDPPPIPSEHALLINSGATSTMSPDVTLIISATNAREMLLGNDQNFTGAVWENYATIENWKLIPVLGTTTVYARFRNQNNVTSSIISRSIMLLLQEQSKGNTGVASTTLFLVSPVVTRVEETPATLARTSQTNTETCVPYLKKYIRFGGDNDMAEVRKLQRFLVQYEGVTDLTETGAYDESTQGAVFRFQQKYRRDILGPWNRSAPTGYVYKTTLKKINEIYCSNGSTGTATSLDTADRSSLGSTTCPYFTKRLIFNSSHSKEVPKLQEFLKNQGFLDTRVATGTTVDKTMVDAIKAFQQKYRGEALHDGSTLTPSGYWLGSSILKANQLMGCGLNGSH